MMKIGIVALAGAVFCAVVVAQTRPAPPAGPSTRPATGPATQARLPFTISKETTYLTEPLCADGTVDYVGALNARYSKGVTKDTNAAVILVTLLPDLLAKEVREEAFKRLDIKPAAGQVTLDLASGDKKEYAPLQATPWKSSDSLDAAKWLKANEKGLNLLIQAAARPRYYVPLLSDPRHTLMFELPTPDYSQLRAASRVLLMRANLAIGEGRVADAWKDIRAVYQLAALLEQDTTLVGRLVEVGMGNLANAGALNIAASGKLSAKDAKTMIAELERIPVATTLDAIEFERLEMLDLIVRLATGGGEQKNLMESLLVMIGEKPGDMGKFPQAMTDAAKGIDWNDILLRANQMHDKLLAAVKAPSVAARTQLAATISQETKQMLARIAAGGGKPPAASAPVKERTQWMGDFIIGLLMPAIEKTQTMAEAGAVQRQMTMISLAAAACRADKGRFPEKLADLSPAYLKQVPKDFFSGKDFVYKPAADGYILYSVGENGKDDGGKGRSENGDDLVVRIMRR